MSALKAFAPWLTAILLFALVLRVQVWFPEPPPCIPCNYHSFQDVKNIIAATGHFDGYGQWYWTNQPIQLPDGCNHCDLGHVRVFATTDPIAAISMHDVWNSTIHDCWFYGGGHAYFELHREGYLPR